ncbi:hypothetical protein EYF80_019289 [Liparis tanakae]|uniref:Uncharacterized protein n=1 Tax=Liparis tanakae TaxID=230148 RepID=A0A4Z2HZW0_9TELE|nr:hypothetical protein EYF80_019289 [Liparis tanakae]
MGGEAKGEVGALKAARPRQGEEQAGLVPAEQGQELLEVGYLGWLMEQTVNWRRGLCGRRVMQGLGHDCAPTLAQRVCGSGDTEQQCPREKTPEENMLRENPKRTQSSFLSLCIPSSPARCDFCQMPRPPTDELNDRDLWEATVRGKVLWRESDCFAGHSVGLLGSGGAVGRWGAQPTQATARLTQPNAALDQTTFRYSTSTNKLSLNRLENDTHNTIRPLIQISL